MRIISGIYKIEDIKAGNVYIGSANQKNGIAKRWSNHLSRLKKGKYDYSEIQEAWNSDINRIKWEILEECSDDELEEREQYWVNYCNRIDGWTVINKEKNIKRKSSVKDTAKMIEAQTGEKNGHCTKLSKTKVFEILEMRKQGISCNTIADKFNVYPSYIGRIGKDRWVKEYEEWKQKEKEAKSIGVEIAPSALDTSASVHA